MASTGQVFPTAGVSIAEDPWLDNTWTTPGNITADDDATANVTAASFDSPDQTFVLKATGFDFSAIPDGSTINGVTARVNAWFRTGQGSGSLDLCQLLDTSAAKVGTNQCATPVALITTTTTIITKGSAADLWGNALTAAWVKSANFGIALGILATAANADVDVDYVTLEIDYTPPAVELDGSAPAASATSASAQVARPLAATGTAGAAAAAELTVTSGGGGAVTIRGGSPLVVATASNPVSGTLTGTRQPQAGDLLVIVHGNNFYAASAMPIPTVGGSSTGVNPVTNGTADAGTNQAHIKSYTYAVGSAGDLTVSVTETGTPDEEKVLVVYVLAGADTSSPIDGGSAGAAGAFSTTAQTSQAAPAVTPSGSNAFLIVHDNAGAGDAGGPYTPPASPYAEQYDGGITFLSYTGGTEQLSAAGSTGTRTVTATTATRWAAVTLAVKTASGAGAVDLDGMATAAATASTAAPDISRALDASSPAASAATADLATARPVTASGAAASTATAELSIAGQAPLDGTGSAAGTASGTLATSRPFAATVFAAAATTSALATIRLLAATGDAAAAAAGQLDVSSDVLLAATAETAAAAAGALTIARAINAQAHAAAHATGQPWLTRPLAGIAAAATHAACAAAVTRPLAGVAAAAGIGAAELTALPNNPIGRRPRHVSTADTGRHMSTIDTGRHMSTINTGRHESSSRVGQHTSGG